MIDLPSERQFRIVLVDDEPLVRKGILAVMAAYPRLTFVAMAEYPDDALSLIEVHGPDAVITDLKMPKNAQAREHNQHAKFAGLDLVAQLKRTRPNLPVVVTSFFDDRDVLVRVFEAGAAGFVSKMRPEDFPLAIEAVCGGAAYFPGDLWRALSERKHKQRISPRELQVSHLVAYGLKSSEIGRMLGNMAPGTVDTHRSNIIGKLGIDADRLQNECIELTLNRWPDWRYRAAVPKAVDLYRLALPVDQIIERLALTSIEVEILNLVELRKRERAAT